MLPKHRKRFRIIYIARLDIDKVWGGPCPVNLHVPVVVRKPSFPLDIMASHGPQKVTVHERKMLNVVPTFFSEGLAHQAYILI